MITMLTLFRADFFVKREIGTPEEREALLKQIRDRQQQDPAGVNRSNDGCWRGNFDDRSPLQMCGWLYKEIDELLTKAHELYKDEDHVYSTFERNGQVVINMWANINQHGSRNTYHSHKAHHYVGVYYLQGTDTGSLIMANPANVLGDCNLEAPYTHDFAFAPKDGDLVLWPAWVPHEVEPNLSNRERINLAFNIKLKT